MQDGRGITTDEWKLSQCFLQPLTSTQVHLLQPLSHKCFYCVLGMQITWGGRMEITLQSLHTHWLQPQFLLLPNQCVGLLALANKSVFSVNGCALFSFLFYPFHSRKMKNNPTKWNQGLCLQVGFWSKQTPPLARASVSPPQDLTGIDSVVC